MSLKTCCDKGVAPTLLEKRASKVGSMTFVDAVRVALLYRKLAYRYLLYIEGIMETYLLAILKIT